MDKNKKERKNKMSRLIYPIAILNKTPFGICNLPIQIKFWLLRKKKILPKEYVQLKYIGSSGTQHINTGTQSKYNNRFIVDAQIDTLDRYNQLIGQYNSTKGAYYSVYVGNTNKYSYSWGNGYENYETPLADTNRHVYDVSINGFYLDDVLLGTVTGTENTPSKTNFLFWANSTSRKFVGKIYSAKIYEGDTLVRDFVPCYRKSDNVAGMYDLVTETFFVNDGTGEFIKGGKV